MTFCSRAQYYNIEYQEERDFNFVGSLVQHPRQSILEIPCGAGRLSRHLASLSDDLTIVDFSEAMLKQAKLSMAEMDHKAKICSHACDMRTLNLARRFDLILVPRESLQLLDLNDASNTIRKLIKHLTPCTGRLLIDLTTFKVPGDPDYFYDLDVEKWHMNWTRHIDEQRTLSRRSREKRTDQPSGVEFTFQYEEKDGKSSRQWTETFWLWKYDVCHIFQMTAEESVKIEVWGSYKGESYTSSSGRLIALIEPR